MRKELDDKLVQTFPNLYTDRYADKKVSCMYWGFECYDGWFQIIWDLSEKLEKEIIKFRERHHPEAEFPRASQVKEKFGSLSFYMANRQLMNDKMHDAIFEAEDRSAKTCELCGKAGKIITTDTGWRKCKCEDCKNL